MDHLAEVFFDESNFRSAVIIGWMDNHVEVLIVPLVVYFLMVWFGPRLIQKPLNLHYPFMVWNLVLSVFSFVGLYKTAPMLIKVITEHSFEYSICANPLEWYLAPGESSGYWICLFILSKIPELFDTFFLVFQKKNVMFLHWYHHITVALYCWFSFTFRTSTGLWFCVMNFCVHSVMYLYFGATCTTLGRKILRPIAPLITVMQLLQMVVGSIVTVAAARVHMSGRICHVDEANYVAGLLMYLSYFVLFAHLFYKNYLAPDARHKKREAAAAKAAQAVKDGSKKEQ